MLKKTVKLIFNLIPFKKYLFLLIKFIYTPSQNIYQHLVFKGIFKVFSGSNSFKIYNTATIIENQLFWKGLDGFEPHSLKIWARLCKNADTIFDLGANSGVYSLVAKSENPNSRVYAFEPVERVFKVLEKNISINNYDVACFKKATSNIDGTGYFFDDDEPFTNSVVVNMDLQEVAEGRGVETNSLHKVETELITLDTFIKKNSIANIDLMKIDVETHEPEVFEGFQDNLKDFKPTLLVEIIRDHVASYLEEQLSNLGYIFFYINEPFGGVDVETEGEIYQKVETLIGGTFGNYLFCSNEKAKELNLI
tara:strand:+ start:599 stop:1522 length:924 start_codon:yes stop_codon:yes gene_type:complete